MSRRLSLVDCRKCAHVKTWWIYNGKYWLGFPYDKCYACRLKIKRGLKYPEVIKVIRRCKWYQPATLTAYISE